MLKSPFKLHLRKDLLKFSGTFDRLTGFDESINVLDLAHVFVSLVCRPVPHIMIKYKFPSFVRNNLNSPSRFANF